MRVGRWSRMGSMCARYDCSTCCARSNRISRLLALAHRPWRGSVWTELKCRELEISHAERVDRAIPVDLGRVERASALDPILVGEYRDLVLGRARHWVSSLPP